MNLLLTLLCVLLAVCSAAGGRAAPNLALGKPYTLLPAPNYSHCTDPGDKVQLTDGKHVEGYFWVQKGCVGWQHTGFASITVDLGKVEPISGAAYTTAAGKASVHWPKAVHIQVSDDGEHFYEAGELVSAHLASKGPWPKGYAVLRLVASNLKTHGRYVRFLVIGEPYIFCDEVEVFAGPPELLQEPLQGLVLSTDPAEAAKLLRIEDSIRARFAADCSALKAEIESARLPAETRQRFLEQLEHLRLQLAKEAPGLVKPDFKAVLPFNETHRRLFELQAALWNAQGLPDFDAWIMDRWAPVALFGPPRKPSGKPLLEFIAMRGEYRSAACLLYSTSAGPRSVTLRLRELPEQALASLEAFRIPWTDTREGTPVADALVPLEKTQAGWRLELLPGLPQLVWFTFHPLELPAGEYSGRLELAVPGGEPVELLLRLKVSPLAFPQQTSLLAGGWSYTDGKGHLGVTQANRSALLKMLQSHFVNAPWAQGSVLFTQRFTASGVELDTQSFDDWVAQWPRAKAYYVFLNVPSSFSGAALGTPAFDERVGEWIKAWVAHWRTLQLAPSQVRLLLLDEPRPGMDIKPIVAWSKALHKAVPEIVVWEDPIYLAPEEAPGELWPASDVLCPNRIQWLEHRETFRRFYLHQQAQGKTLNFYSCSGPVRLFDPYTYYLLQPWHAWQLGATGSFFWSLSDNAGTSSWNEYAAPRTTYAPLFLDEQSAWSARHFEAFREGIQDYEYLALLKAALAKAPPSPLRAEAEHLLKAGPERVLSAEGWDDINWTDPKQRSVADEVRLQVLDLLEKLEKAKGGNSR